MEKRILGKTGEKLSILGFGGILVNNEPQEKADKLVAEAVERGINYFDVAPTYGNAQDKLGPALEPYRKNVFLACKTTQRSKEGAEKELQESFKKLKTDYFDLYQVHGLANMEETKQALGPNGAIETFVKAKKGGKIKHIGFSVHDIESALYAIKNFDFETVLFPVNFVTYYTGNFGPQIRDAATNKNMGLLALKSMAKTKWPEGKKDHPYSKCWYEPVDNPELAKLALRFTLSEPVTALLPPGEEKLFHIALDILEKGFKPLTKEERNQLKTAAKSYQPIFQYAA